MATHGCRFRYVANMLYNREYGEHFCTGTVGSCRRLHPPALSQPMHAVARTNHRWPPRYLQARSSHAPSSSPPHMQVAGLLGWLTCLAACNHRRHQPGTTPG